LIGRALVFIDGAAKTFGGSSLVAGSGLDARSVSFIEFVTHFVFFAEDSVKATETFGVSIVGTDRIAHSILGALIKASRVEKAGCLSLHAAETLTSNSCAGLKVLASASSRIARLSLRTKLKGAAAETVLNYGITAVWKACTFLSQTV
jgi:hypothetical protein